MDTTIIDKIKRILEYDSYSSDHKRERVERLYMLLGYIEAPEH